MVQRFYISDKNYDQKTIVKSENVEFSTLMKVNIQLEIFVKPLLKSENLIKLTYVS